MPRGYFSFGSRDILGNTTAATFYFHMARALLAPWRGGKIIDGLSDDDQKEKSGHFFFFFFFFYPRHFTQVLLLCVSIGLSG